MREHHRHIDLEGQLVSGSGVLTGNLEAQAVDAVDLAGGLVDGAAELAGNLDADLPPAVNR